MTEGKTVGVWEEMIINPTEQQFDGIRFSKNERDTIK